MPDLVFRKTSRGFDIVNFTDLYGSSCSLQRSSLVEPDAVWLGTDHPDSDLSTRMHLTQDMVRDMLPALQRFVETGELT